MLTCCLAALKGLCACLPLTQKDENIQTASTDDPLSPLLDHSPAMPPLRKYGTKRSTSSAVSSNIFGRSHPAAAGPSSDTAPLPIPSRPAAPAPRDPLSELSSNFGALALKERGKPEYTLLPLATFQLFPKSWGTVFSSADTLEKIAEASFAEVFRCSNASGTSILKVMQLKVSTNPASLEDVHASSAEMVVSELQVMDVLTEVPGFVQLKEFHLIKGNPGAHFKKAWDAFSKLRPTEYPNPDDYTSQSVFLVIELGDAGEVLENKPMKQLEQVWDVLLQVIIALARAEATNEFEHRDLHENNVCVLQTSDSSFTSFNPSEYGDLKLGFSGLQITLIDYGLSRAKLRNQKVAFNDLEQDLSLFRGYDNRENPKMQYDTYRRMRTYLTTGERTANPVPNNSKNINEDGHSWKQYTPYSNVLWIRYLYFYLQRDFKKHGGEKAVLKEFQEQTKELRTRMDTRTKDGAFMSAQEVLIHVVEQGWVSEEQLEERGIESSSFLSEL